MKRQRKSRKRSSNDSNDEIQLDNAKGELVVGLEEISASQRYIPVFGKNLQPKQKAAKTDSIKEESLCDKTTEHIRDKSKVDEEEANDVPSTQTKDDLIEKLDLIKNDRNATFQCQLTKEIEEEEDQQCCSNKDVPKMHEPQIVEPQKDEPKIHEPQLDGPKLEEPQKDKPKEGETSKEEPHKDEPHKDEPQKDELKTDQSKIAESQTDKAPSNEPLNDKLRTDEPQKDKSYEKGLQKDEIQTAGSKLLNSPVKIHTQGIPTFSKQAAITKDELVSERECKDDFKVQLPEGETFCKTEGATNSSIALAITNQGDLLNSKDGNSVLISHESDCDNVQGAKTEGPNDEASRFVGICSSKENELDHTMKGDREESTCDKEQECNSVKTSKGIVERKIDSDGNRKEVTSQRAIIMNTARSESVVSLFGESEDRVKRNNEQSRESKYNEGEILCLQDKEEVQSGPIRNENDKKNESPLHNISPKHTDPKSGLIDVNLQKKINKTEYTPKINSLILSQEEEGLIKEDPTKRNIAKGQIIKTADVQSFLEYDEDAMMTDSQINLLDEDILILPQCVIQEHEVPDMKEAQHRASGKSLGDYIADGDRLMKGIIEEISGITKTIVNMKKFIDTVKKQKQTRINTIWKYGKPN